MSLQTFISSLLTKSFLTTCSLISDCTTREDKSPFNSIFIKYKLSTPSQLPLLTCCLSPLIRTESQPKTIKSSWILSNKSRGRISSLKSVLPSSLLKLVIWAKTKLKIASFVLRWLMLQNCKTSQQSTKSPTYKMPKTWESHNRTGSRTLTNSFTLTRLCQNS